MDEEPAAVPLMRLGWRERERRRSTPAAVLAGCSESAREAIATVIAYTSEAGELRWGADGWRHHDEATGAPVLAVFVDIVAEHELLEALAMNWVWTVSAGFEEDTDAEVVQLDALAFRADDPFELRVTPDRSMHDLLMNQRHASAVTLPRRLLSIEQHRRLMDAWEDHSRYRVSPGWTLDALSRALSEWLEYFGGQATPARFDEGLQSSMVAALEAEVEDPDDYVVLCQVCRLDAPATVRCCVEVDGQPDVVPLCDDCADDHGWILGPVVGPPPP